MKKLFLYAALLLISFNASSADNKPENKILATVNGTPITGQEVQHFTSKLSQPVGQARALQEMINVELLSQAAKKEGMLDDEAFKLELKRVTTGLIASHYLQQTLLKLDISEQDLKKRYEEEYVNNKTGLEYNANHILLKTQQEAEDIIKQLNEGADFAELAKKHSTGPSGSKGGALGWFKAGDMVETFSKAAQALKPGEYTRHPIETEFGWHVIKLNETRPIAPPAFESVQQNLATAIAAEEINRVMKSLHDSADIIINKADNKEPAAR
jgi:peptidyl-prolyl cis-trans isomerase C